MYNWLEAASRPLRRKDAERCTRLASLMVQTGKVLANELRLEVIKNDFYAHRTLTDVALLASSYL